MESVKCVVVGDGAVGKTCLLISYCNNTYTDTYIPTIFDNFQTNLYVDGKPMSLNLWDTAGQEDYDRLRLLSYSKTDLFLLCYAVNSPTSLANLKSRWAPEITRYAPECRFLVVGTKADLRDNDSVEQGHLVTAEKGEQVANELGADGYFECSAKTQAGLKNVFDQVVRTAQAPRKTIKSEPRLRKKCSLV